MATTVIVIRGNSSQSLLNRIADALQDQEQVRREEIKTEEVSRPVKVDSRSYKYTLTPQNEKEIRKYVKQHPSFHYTALIAHLRANGLVKVFNKDIVDFLQRNKVQKVRDLYTQTNIWTTSKR